MRRLLLIALLLALPVFDALAQTECWCPREEQDTVDHEDWAMQRKWLLAAEAIVAKDAAFLASPVPVRMRSTIAAGPIEHGARLWTKAYPEKSTVGFQVWTGKCEVIPQADRIASSIGAIGVFFNYVTDQMFFLDEAPERTGTFGGYPQYREWVVITKDGRMPWIPQTLGERIERERTRHLEDYDEWKKGVERRKMPDRAGLMKTYDMLKAQDPAGAEKFLASMKQLEEDIRTAEASDGKWKAHFEKLLADNAAYRARFTPAQLAMPVTWGDASGAGKKSLEARITALQRFTPAEQARYDALVRAKQHAEARAFKKAHTADAFFPIQEARAEYELTNLRPGTAANAFKFKLDPTFPDPRQPNRIQVIAVQILTTDTRGGRDVWMKKAKAAFDWAALARMLD